MARSVELIEETMLKEFEGELPVARINYFAVYRICLKILKAINAAEHPQDGADKICGCASVRLFRLPDEYIDNSHFMHTSCERHLIKNCREMVLSSMEDKPLTDFLWQI